MRHLDSDQLRTFLAVADAGSVTGGAERIHRSQSATSLQISQLEDTVGQPLFRRHGRGVWLTVAGEQLMPVARKVVASLDDALMELRHTRLSGTLKIGVPDGHGAEVLTGIVTEFSAKHPGVRLEVTCASGAGFATALESGILDLAVFHVSAPRPDDEILQRDKLAWLCRPDFRAKTDEDLAVALFDRECWWREAGLNVLEQSGFRPRIVFASESEIGVRAAVFAGMAAGFLGLKTAPQGLIPVPGVSIRLPTFSVLRQASRADPVLGRAMSDAIRKAFQAASPQPPATP